MTQVTYTQDTIKALLETSNKAVEKALLTLYDRQTEDEQVSQATSHVNGRGFSAFDVEILSSFACWIQRKQGQKVELGKCLTEKQMILARKKVVRYAKQLAEVANAKATPKEEVKMDKGLELEREQWAMENERNISIVEEFSTQPLDVLKDTFGLDYAIDIATKAIEDESKRPFSYYNGRSILSILCKKLSDLEAEKAAVEVVVEEKVSKPVDSWIDPEHRAFRAAQDKISQWVAR